MVAVTVVQEPLPLHTDGGVMVNVLEHAAGVQTTLPSGKAQSVADVPPQRPAQAACVPAHAFRLPRGAPLTVTHVPALFGSWQAWHCPSQELEQQTPSTQKALAHSTPVWQSAPFALTARQRPVGSQYFPTPQGEAALQPPAHFVASAHCFVWHIDVIAAVHPPAPLHTVAVDTEPLAQLAATHETSFPGYLHAIPSVPSHRAAQGAVPPQAGRGPRGDPLIMRHLPAPPLGSLHDEHCPVHSLSQQTPSTQ